jgi:glycosyltransferase involved in cell wall biosynthesis
MPKLSVITAIYNAEKYIKDSLDSVFNQPYDDFELILIDDGSTDNTLKLIEPYIEKSNVTLLQNKYNEGYGFSRNRGFLSAQGEYIAIHDADDVTLNHRFQKEVDLLDEKPKITVVGGHAIRISDTGQPIGSMVYPPEFTEGAFRVITQFKLNPVIDPSSMFRKQSILDIGAYRMEPKLKTVCDFDLWCRLLLEGHHFYNFQEPLIKYRINPNGVTRIKKQEQVEATDLVWAAFRRKSFPKVTLRRDCFVQDFDLGMWNNKETENGEGS